jgi:hypothetical protein
MAGSLPLARSLTTFDLVVMVGKKVTESMLL